MPLTVKQMLSLPTDPVQWAKYLQSLPVAPDDGTITDATFGNRVAFSVIGNPDTTTGKPRDITAASDRYVLIRRPTGVAFDGLQVADLPTAVATDSEVAAADAVVASNAASALTAAITTHEAASDPHPQYLTQTEGDARYLQLTLTLTNAVDDAAAATAGVAVGRLYRNGSVVMIRVV